MTSNNAGSSWFTYNVPAGWAIATCPSNTNMVYLAGNGQLNQYVSPSTFNNKTSGLVAAGYDVNLKITDIDVHPINANYLYISVAGANVNAKVFTTVDGGNTWINWTYNLPNVPIFSIKRDQNDGLYVGTSIGVFTKK
ncbi:MAG: hypothetical protein IPO92_15215 [Saprospiraceae bacterium]|nr:hypothetical protein [Saprospiraceae bacterium]